MPNKAGLTRPGIITFTATAYNGLGEVYTSEYDVLVDASEPIELWRDHLWQRRSLWVVTDGADLRYIGTHHITIHNVWIQALDDAATADPAWQDFG
jgi:hypothetical protein